MPGDLFGGSETKVQRPKPTPEQRELQRTAVALAERQLRELERLTPSTEALLPFVLRGFGLQAVETGGEAPPAPGGATGAATQLRDLRRQLEATPERIAAGTERVRRVGDPGFIRRTRFEPNPEFQRIQQQILQLQRTGTTGDGAAPAPQPGVTFEETPRSLRLAEQRGQLAERALGEVTAPGGTTLGLQAGRLSSPLAGERALFRQIGNVRQAGQGIDINRPGIRESILGLRGAGQNIDINRPGVTGAIRDVLQAGDVDFGPGGQLTRGVLEDIQSAQGATPQERALVEEATQRAIAAGESDIEGFQQRALENIREVLAPELGLRPSDTPNIDRGGRVARESIREQAELVQELRAQQARRLLDLPFQRNELALGAAIPADEIATRRLLEQAGLGLAGARSALEGSLGLGRLGLAEAGERRAALEAALGGETALGELGLRRGELGLAAERAALGGTEAAGRLGLARESALTENERLQEQAQQFQQQLAENAELNRLRLFQNLTGTRLGLATGQFDVGDALEGFRTGTETTAESQPGLLDLAGGVSGLAEAGVFSGIGSLFGGGGSAAASAFPTIIGLSDRRLKRDVRRIGSLSNGLGIYRYRFTGDRRERIGVMAQEVRRIVPEAVVRHASGYLMVDYGKLLEAV